MNIKSIKNILLLTTFLFSSALYAMRELVSDDGDFVITSDGFNTWFEDLTPAGRQKRDIEIAQQQKEDNEWVQRVLNNDSWAVLAHECNPVFRAIQVEKSTRGKYIGLLKRVVAYPESKAFLNKPVGHEAWTPLWLLAVNTKNNLIDTLLDEEALDPNQLSGSEVLAEPPLLAAITHNATYLITQLLGDKRLSLYVDKKALAINHWLETRYTPMTLLHQMICSYRDEHKGYPDRIKEMTTIITALISRSDFPLAHITAQLCDDLKNLLASHPNADEAKQLVATKTSLLISREIFLIERKVELNKRNKEAARKNLPVKRRDLSAYPLDF